MTTTGVGIDLPSTGELPADAGLGELAVFNGAGMKTPFFVVQSWDTELSNLQRLASLLGPEQPIYAVNPPRGDTPEDYHRRDWLWSDAARAVIEATGYKGPWRLGGWSFGGTLALRIAHSFAERGDEVEAVVMYDSAFPRTPAVAETRRKPKSKVHRAAYVVTDYLELLPEDRQAFRDTKKKYWTKTVKVKFGGGTGQYFEEKKSDLGLLTRAIHVAYLHYDPFYTWVPTHIMWTDESMDKRQDIALGWGANLRGPFTSVRIEGGHYSMWSPANVGDLAAKTAAVFADLEARS